MGGAILFRALVAVEMAVRQVARAFLVPGLCRRQIAQKLAGIGILRPLRRHAVEIGRVAFHLLRLFAHPVEAEVFHQPDRAAGVETRDMLAPDQGDDLTEAGAVAFDQPVAVLVLLGGHILEHPGRAGIIGAQAFGIGAVDARVVFLGGNGEREDLLLAQIGEPPTIGQGRKHRRPHLGMVPN